MLCMKASFKIELLCDLNAQNITTGVLKLIVQWIFNFSNALDTNKEFQEDILKNLLNLCNCNADFLLSVILEEEKTAGWLAENLLKFAKIWL